MEDLTIIRKRYIPNEEIDISNDRVLLDNEKTLITKWFPIKPRGDFAWGISYVDLNDNYKISRFYNKDDKFLFWYCDILEITIDIFGKGRKYILTDLLIDIIVYPNGHYEIKDIDELEEALDKGLIDEKQHDAAIFAMNRLIDRIRKGKFPPQDFNYRDYERGHVDLHLHSCFSDGTMTPAELVRQAKIMNLTAISLTDHDSIDGIEEAMQEAGKLGIEFIPGVEFSADNIHILGYFPKGGIGKLDGVFEKYLINRRIRAEKMVSRLTGFGMPITYSEIVSEAGSDRFIGRVHFAKVMVKKGYVRSVKEAFIRWIGEGRPGFVRKEGYTDCEIINKINECGGVPVLAHPRQIRKGSGKKAELIKRLAENGMKGIEVYYPDNTDSETKESIRYAREYGLIMTGGSDFHGSNKPGINIGTGRGKLIVPYECVSDLRRVQQFFVETKTSHE